MTFGFYSVNIKILINRNKHMAQEFIQLTLALMPAVAIGYALNRVNMPWDKKKQFSERAELLSLMARDVKGVKSIMARHMAAINSGRACALPSLPLSNWKKMKHDKRLKKYVDEPLFQKIITQLQEWETA